MKAPLKAAAALLLCPLIPAVAFAQETAPASPPASQQTSAQPSAPAAAAQAPPVTDTPATNQQPSGQNNPIGTAAAPYQKGVGVPASRPAGAVIAPGKQKRSRSFYIKVGLIVAAAVAVGIVVGASLASSSTP